MTGWIDPQGRRVISYTPDALDHQQAADMAARIIATKSRPISEAMPEFFGDVRRTPFVSIRVWRE